MSTRVGKRRLMALAAVALCAVLTLGVLATLDRGRDPDPAQATIASLPSASDARSAEEPVVAGALPGERAIVPTPPQLVALPPSKVIRTSDCVIRGHVTTDDREQPPIDIELFALAGGLPDRMPADSTSADRNGDFVLHPQTYGEFVVVALAEAKAPATVRATFEPHAEVVLAPIVLSRGAEIFGEVREFGRRVGPGMLVRARLFADRLDERVRDVSAENLIWRNGEFEWAMRVAHTDGAAQFALSGLATDTYSLSLSKPEGAEFEFELGDIERIAAPASGVVLDVSTCKVKLHFFIRGAPAGRFSFFARNVVEHLDGGSKWMQADGDGNATLEVVPNARVGLYVRRRISSAGGMVGQMGDSLLREIVGGAAGSVLDMRIDVPEPDAAATELLRSNR